MTVYFARVAGSGRVKIGYVMHDSAEQPSAVVLRRLQIISMKFKTRVYLAATTEGRRWMERWFHLRHAKAALGREWFRETPLLAADIAVLAAGGRVDGQPDLKCLSPVALNHVGRYDHWHRIRCHDGEWSDEFWSRRGRLGDWRVHLRRLRKAAFGAAA